MFLSSCWKSVMMCTAPKYSIHNWDIVAITSGGKNPTQAAHVLLLDTHGIPPITTSIISQYHHSYPISLPLFIFLSPHTVKPG